MQICKCQMSTRQTLETVEHVTINNFAVYFNYRALYIVHLMEC